MQNVIKTVLVVLAVLGVLALVYIIWVSVTTGSVGGTVNFLEGKRQSNSNSRMVAPINMPIEAFDTQSPADMVGVSSGLAGMPTQAYSVDASESLGTIEQPQGLQQPNPVTLNQLPSECYPKDVLSSADLLPRDANSLWAQVNPSGQGSLADQNFLTSGFHQGINSVGQSLRNANRQLRSEPLNPQVKVSPWMQTTIEPDINRRPLEIQGDL
jgi:hypothetical protein